MNDKSNFLLPRLPALTRPAHALWLCVHIESINESTGSNTAMLLMCTNIHKPVWTERNVFPKTSEELDKGARKCLERFRNRANNLRRKRKRIFKCTLRIPRLVFSVEEIIMSFCTWKRYWCDLTQSRPTTKNISNDELIAFSSPFYVFCFFTRR